MLIWFQIHDLPMDEHKEAIGSGITFSIDFMFKNDRFSLASSTMRLVRVR